MIIVPNNIKICLLGIRSMISILDVKSFMIELGFAIPLTKVIWLGPHMTCTILRIINIIPKLAITIIIVGEFRNGL